MKLSGPGRRQFAASTCAVMALVAVIPGLAGAAPTGHPRTGRIVVKLVPPSGTSTSGFSEVCAVNRARALKYGVNARSIIGKCATPNTKNVAILTKVPAGHCAIAGVGGAGSVVDPAKVGVRAGHTTKVTWRIPMWG